MQILSDLTPFQSLTTPGVTVYIRRKTHATRIQLNSLLIRYREAHNLLYLQEQTIRATALERAKTPKRTVSGAREVLVIEQPSTNSPNPSTDSSIPKEGLLPSENDVFTPHPPPPAPPPAAQLTPEEDMQILSIRDQQAALLDTHYMPSFLITYVERVTGHPPLILTTFDDSSETPDTPITKQISIRTANDLLEYGSDLLIPEIVSHIGEKNGLSQEEKLNLGWVPCSAWQALAAAGLIPLTPASTASTLESIERETVVSFLKSYVEGGSQSGKPFSNPPTTEDPSKSDSIPATGDSTSVQSPS